MQIKLGFLEAFAIWYVGRAKTMKQPWKMTRDEWYREVDATRINFSGTGGGNTSDKQKLELLKRRRWLRMDLPDYDAGDGLMVPASHEHMIAQAKKEGKL